MGWLIFILELERDSLEQLTNEKEQVRVKKKSEINTLWWREN